MSDTDAIEEEILTIITFEDDSSNQNELHIPPDIFCTPCNMSFETMEEFKKHSTETHTLLIPRKPSLVCEICTATFTRRDHLKRHMSILHDETLFNICPVCGKNFEHRRLFLKHVNKKHSSKDQEFNCRECSYTCDNFRMLEKHEKTHSLSRHECPHCNTTFTRKDHMVRHVKTQHLNQFVVCVYCSLQFKRQDHLTRHLRVKHGVFYVKDKYIKIKPTTSNVS